MNLHIMRKPKATQQPLIASKTSQTKRVNFNSMKFQEIVKQIKFQNQYSTHKNQHELN